MKTMKIVTAAACACALSFSVMAETMHATPGNMPMGGGQMQMPMNRGQMPMNRGQMPMRGCGTGNCMGGRHMGMMNPQMKQRMMANKQQMMAMKQEHMKKMESHLANIEALLRELVEMQKKK